MQHQTLTICGNKICNKLTTSKDDKGDGIEDMGIYLQLFFKHDDYSSTFCEIDIRK